jgi:hypothetical protein
MSRKVGLAWAYGMAAKMEVTTTIKKGTDIDRQDMPRSTSAACETGNGEEPNMYTRKPGITLK